MLLKLSLLLVTLWLCGVLFNRGGFIHIPLLVAIALAVVHFTRRHRCGEPPLKF